MEGVQIMRMRNSGHISSEHPKSDIARVNDIYAAYLSGGKLNNRHVHFVRFNRTS